MKNFIGKQLIMLGIGCVIAVFGLFLLAPAHVQAAAAQPAMVGVVDYTGLINTDPDATKAKEALIAERDQAKKEYDSKAAGLNDQDRHALEVQLEQRVEQKRLDLLNPILEKINAAIKEVADAKGLTVIVEKNMVEFGGQDITTDVMKKLGIAN